MQPKVNKRSSSLRFFLRFTLFIIIPLFTMGGCKFPPRAAIWDLDFLYKIANGTANFQSIDYKVTGFGNITQYRYAIGNNIDCKSTTYSDWISKETRLTLDVSFLQSGPAFICLLGRRPNESDPQIWDEQPISLPTIHQWTQDEDPPVTPAITSPTSAAINLSTPTIAWQGSDDSVSYDLNISNSDTDCVNGLVQTYVGLTNTSQSISQLAEGQYHVCVRSKDAAGNSSLPGKKTLLIDTSPPGTFMITAPSGTVNTMSPTIQLSSASGADQYHVMVASNSNCSSSSVLIDQMTSQTSIQVNLASPGTYYICSEAMDMAGNMQVASNNGSQFTIQTTNEIILKDHVSDLSCLEDDKAFYHYNDPGNKDAVAAAAFIGQGNKLKRVGGVFSHSNCTVFNGGHPENMTASLLFYQNKDVFISDPYLQNPPSGSMRVDLPILNTNPQDPNYYLNPIRTTQQGTNQYYVEVDASPLNITTINGQEHLVALWLRSDSTNDGIIWMAFSKGCPGQVGDRVDYYRSNLSNPVLGPDLFSVINPGNNYAAYFISEATN